MADKSETDHQVRLPRAAIDMRMPLPWLLGIAGVVAWLAISLYFSVDTLKSDTAEVKSTLRSLSAISTQVMSEQTLIKYRLEKLEAARSDHK